MKNKKYFLVFFVLGFLGAAQKQAICPFIPSAKSYVTFRKSIVFKGFRIVNHEPIAKKIVNLFKQELDSLNLSAKKSGMIPIFFEKKLISKENPNTYKILLDTTIKLQANTYKGWLYGTRTLLQIFVFGKNKFKKAEIVDAPKYEKRMLLLDVARKFFTFEEIKDFIRAMAWVKMNELHLHLSDNSWGGYSAYRLPSKLYPNLTAKDGHYSWEEIKKLQDFAKIYGIAIIPEIDSPGHAKAFTNIRPDLKSPWLSENYLDISNEKTYAFMEEILGEVIPHFEAEDFHLGTDEYRLHSIKDTVLKNKLGENFRTYINYFNKILKKHGKKTRIWSGYEKMPGNTKIDKDIIIDMWETSDAKNKAKQGYYFINASHFYTYIVPGAPYYGVDEKFVYEKWTPEIFSDKKTENLEYGTKNLLGSKMHIWNDFGPSGYTNSEIARLSIPSMFVFAEKMWGQHTQKEAFQKFKKKAKKLLKIPMTHILKREFKAEKIIFNLKKIIKTKNHFMDLKKLKTDSIKNVEYPWSLEITLTKKSNNEENEVLLSSNLATIYSHLSYDFKTEKDTLQKSGIAIIRANQTLHETPIKSHKPQVIVFDYALEKNRKTNIQIVGEKGKTSIFVNGNYMGTKNIQMLCPMEYLGSKKEKSFHGKIEFLKVKRIKNF